MLSILNENSRDYYYERHGSVENPFDWWWPVDTVETFFNLKDFDKYEASELYFYQKDFTIAFSFVKK